MQGQGASTRRKIEGLEAVFLQNLGMSKSSQVIRFPYWHVDLHAGCGWNHECDCKGSPLTFLDAAQRVGRVYRAFFCDHDPGLIEQLSSRLSCYDSAPSTISVERCDNAALLGKVGRLIRSSEGNPGKAIGTCLCDPNGFNDMPLEALAEFARSFPRIDLILNINCNLFRSVRGCKRPDAKLLPATIAAFSRWPSLEEMIARFNKDYWFIRNPMRAIRGHNFTLLVGRNIRTKRAPFRGFFPLDSPEGAKILASLKHEEVGQLELPFKETR